jgi:hypothetical protein
MNCCFPAKKNVWIEQLVSSTSDDLDGREWFGSGSGHFNPGKRFPSTLWIWYSVGTVADMHDLGNIIYLAHARYRTPIYQFFSHYIEGHLDSFRKPSLWKNLSIWCRHIPDQSNVTSLNFARRHESFLLNDPSRPFGNAKLSLESTNFVQYTNKSRRLNHFVTVHAA